jgi:hypothetical protein
VGLKQANDDARPQRSRILSHLRQAGSDAQICCEKQRQARRACNLRLIVVARLREN